MQMSDSFMFDMVAARSKSHAGGRYKAELERIRPIANSAQVSMSRLKQNVKNVEVVRDGIAAISQMDSDISEVIWRCLSGLTHGDYWAMLNLLDREEVAASCDGKSITMMTTSSTARVATFLEIALQLTEAAISLYDDRCVLRFQT